MQKCSAVIKIQETKMVSNCSNTIFNTFQNVQIAKENISREFLLISKIRIRIGKMKPHLTLQFIRTYGTCKQGSHKDWLEINDNQLHVSSGYIFQNAS